jgi:hypothetical protein
MFKAGISRIPPSEQDNTFARESCPALKKLTGDHRSKYSHSEMIIENMIDHLNHL